MSSLHLPRGVMSHVPEWGEAGSKCSDASIRRAMLGAADKPISTVTPWTTLLIIGAPAVAYDASIHSPLFPVRPGTAVGHG